MIPLAKPLDTTDFDALLALARGRLPALAKQWTDYNYHDPGIMLIELMAWLADSQVYSLARNRQDERLGFLGLMGARARGARPSRGLVYPAGTPDAVRAIEPSTVLKPARGGAPRLEADAAITLMPVRIARIVTAGPAGIADVTAINALARAAFAAFGPDGDGELRIELAAQGALPQAGPVLLSLGFRLQKGAAGMPVRRLGRVVAVRPDGSRIRRTRDTTFGLQRSGTMVFEIDPAEIAQPIILRPASGYPLNPRLLAIAPNALPVEQRASLEYTDARGTARPGQTLELEQARLFPSDEADESAPWRLVDGPAALRVASISGGAAQAWTRGRLHEAGPGDRRYAADEAADGCRIAIRFGNGINGRPPALDEPISIGLTLSCGDAGTVAQPSDWIMQPSGTSWCNHEPIAGGADAQSPDAGLGELRERLAERRPLASSGQLAQAARNLAPALGIARAHVEEGWERGRRAPATPATRTLIVAGDPPGGEEPAWLDAIRRRLAPRVAAGERLLVVAPRYRRFALSAEIAAVPGSDPARVAAAVRKELVERFDPVRQPWPFGRDVAAAVVAGWIRNVEGVARVRAVRLAPQDRGRGTPELLPVGRGELPSLVGDPDVAAERQQR